MKTTDRSGDKGASARSTAAVMTKPESPQKRSGPVSVQRAMAPPADRGAASRAQTATNAQRTMGNARLSRMLGAPVRPKLTVGPPDDAYEQEADQVADRVMRKEQCPACARAAAGGVQRTCAACERAQRKCAACEGEARRAAKSADTPDVDQELASRIQTVRAGGQPMPDAVRRDMEPQFGQDFRDVRVHTGPEAASTARQMNARAYTVGRDIVFGEGEYAPEGGAGRRLLAHELTHVTQQRDRPMRKALDDRGEEGGGSGTDEPIRRDLLDDVMGGVTGVAHAGATGAIGTAGALGITSGGVEIGFPDFTLIDSLEIPPIKIEPISGTIPIVGVAFPAGPLLFVADLGLRFGAEPAIGGSLGPVRVTDISLLLDPLGLRARGRGTLTIGAHLKPSIALSGGLQARARLIAPTVPPKEVSLALEGGLRWLGRGDLAGQIRSAVSVELNGTSLSFDAVNDLIGAALLQVDLNAFVAARANDKIICEYVWPGAQWQTSGAWQLRVPISAGTGFGWPPIRVGPITSGPIPVDDIVKGFKEPPLGLNCLGFTDLLNEYGPKDPIAGARICSRPLNFPIWTGLPAFRHAFVYDPVSQAKYAIREPLIYGNGVTTSCSPKTSNSGPPDDVETSRCNPCTPKPSAKPPDEQEKDLSRCLQSVYNAYPGPSLYRNLPDPDDGYAHGPNSNSFAAAMAACCDDFDRSGLGILPGWNHKPSVACPPKPSDEYVRNLLTAWAGKPDALVASLASELTAEQKAAVMADAALRDEVKIAVGPLWPATEKILTNAMSDTVPSLDAATVYLAEYCTRTGRYVDALHAIVSKLQARGLINPALATWQYVHDSSHGDGLTSTVPPAASVVEIYTPAFATVPWLYSTIMHEYVHVLQHHEGVIRGPSSLREVEAYLWEIEHARGTGVMMNPAQMKDIGKRLTDHFNSLSAADKKTYQARYDAAMAKVAEASTGTPPIGLAALRRQVQEAARKIAALVRVRPDPTVDPAGAARVDAAIAKLQKEREDALVEVVLSENPIIQVVDRGKGLFRVPMTDPSGTVIYVYGAISVVWHLAQISPSAFRIGATISARPTAGVTTRLGLGGTGIQGRVQPFPGDLDFVEEIDIVAADEAAAGDAAAGRIIEFVARNKGRTDLEFLRLIIFAPALSGPPSGGPRSRGIWTEAEILDPSLRPELARQLSKTAGGNINTFWRAWVDDRFIDITKLLNIRATLPSGKELFATKTFSEFQVAYLDEPDRIPTVRLGEYAATMRKAALEEYDVKHRYLKAAKRAYNYFTAIGNLEAMAETEPIFRTDQARVNQQAAAIEGVVQSLSRRFPTRVLRADDARWQIRFAAWEVGTRLPVVVPLRHPAAIAADLVAVSSRFTADPTGILEPDRIVHRDLEKLYNEVKEIIDFGVQPAVRHIIDTYVR